MKSEREIAKKTKLKIINDQTITGNEDKYLDIYSNENKNPKRIQDDNYYNKKSEENGKYIGSYDTYKTPGNLNEKIGNIMRNVDEKQFNLNLKER